MGCSSACKVFERVSDSLVFILKNHFGVRKVVKYLDDFLFIADTHMECLKALQSFEQMCGMLNIPIAAHKTVHPCTELTFLGYQIDSVRMLVSIPKEKIDSYSVDIRKLMETSSTTLREIKSLIGKLQFVVNVITAGRCFIRRLINLTVGKRHPAQRIIIDETIREDLSMWLNFFRNYNGKNLIQHQFVTNSIALHFYTDSCKSGYGGTFGRKYICGLFPEAWYQYDIQILELYPIYVLLHLFAKDLANSSVEFYCDNLAVVQIMNKQTSRSPTIMRLLRPMICTMLKFNISFKSVHIPGIYNNLCDALSRSQVTESLLRTHGLECHPTPLPQWMRPQNLRI